MTTHMDLQAELRRLQEENARLKANKATSNGIKVSAKGALSVYGLGRFPVTLYRSQWEKLLGMVDEIEAFIEIHADKLRTKDNGEED
jgi:hypothetical protein